MNKYDIFPSYQQPTTLSEIGEFASHSHTSDNEVFVDNTKRGMTPYPFLPGSWKRISYPYAFESPLLSCGYGGSQ